MSQRLVLLQQQLLLSIDVVRERNSSQLACQLSGDGCRPCQH